MCLFCVSSLFGEVHVSAWKADQDSSCRRCCCFHFSCWFYWTRWLQTLSHCTRRLSMKRAADLKSSITGPIWETRQMRETVRTNQVSLKRSCEGCLRNAENRGSREQVKDAKNPDRRSFSFHDRLMFPNTGSASCFSGLC